MEMRYRVYDRKTLDDITDKHKWVILSDGLLYALEYFHLVCYPDAYYVVFVKRNSTWEKVYESPAR